MANIGELILSLQGDSKAWTSATQQAEQSLRSLVKEAQKAGQDLSKFNAQSINTLKGWQNEIGDAYRGLSDSLEPVKQGLVEQGKLFSTTQKGANTLAIETVTGITKQEAFAKALNNVSSKLWVVTMGLQQMGRALMTSLTLPLAGVATLAVKTFADWETGTKQLQASADLTVKQAEDMTNQFRELALVMPLTVKELLEIARTAAEAGVSTKNLDRYTIAIGKLLTISKELNLKDAAEALVAVSRAFGIAESQVERVGSVIRKMAKESRGGMDDFVAAMLRAMPVATVLNISFQDTAAMLAAIIPVSGTATRAGTELNTVFDQMSKNLPKLAGQMGITQEALKEMVSRDAVGTLKMYIESLGVSADQIEKNAAILEIFGATGAKAFRALMSQYDQFLVRQEEAHEAFVKGTELTKDYEIASDTLANSFKIFRSTVLDLAKTIGDDLIPIVTAFIEKATTIAAAIKELWIGLPDGAKKAVIALAAILAVLGPLVLLFNTLISPIVGLVTVVAKATAMLTAFQTAGLGMVVVAGGVKVTLGAVLVVFAKFVLIAVAVVAAVVLIYKALDKLFNISEKLKDALGITAFQQRVQDTQEKIKASLGKINDSFTDSTQNIKDAVAGMMAIAGEWGDKIMERFLYGFREADFGILDDAMRIVESYMGILEKQGTMTAEAIYNNTLQARREIAKAITEVKELGTVSEETRRALVGLVGAARAESILKEITAALKVEEIQETVDNLNEQIKDVRDAMKKETAVIDKAIKERSREYDDQIDAEEDILKALTKRKKEIQKNYKAQLRAFEDAVEITEDERQLAKDRLDAIKESNDLFIDNLQEQKDALQENIDETRDALDELRDLRKDEVSAAEGMLDYAKMNLEAARNQLKKEQAMGKDEWDASYRAALARTDAAENQVDLAYGNYIRTKQLYAKEEKVLEAELEIEQDQLKAINKEIKTAQYAAKEQERIYEEQLEIADDNLDQARRALNDFKDAYQEQSDLIQDEIDTHRDRVDDLRDARDQILTTLRKERDTISEKYEKELDILRDRLDTAQDSLKTTQRILDVEKGINAQRLKLEQERLDLAKELTGGTAFPGIAGLNLEDFNKQLKEATINYEDMMCKMEDVTEQKKGTITKKWEELKETIKNIEWDNIGKTILGLLFPPYGLWLVASEFFKSGTWESIKNWVKDTISNIDWGAIGKIILGLIFPPYGLYLLLGEVFNIDWEGIKNSIVNFVKGIDWGEIGKTILGALFAGPIALGNLGAQIFNAIVSGLSNLGPNLQIVGQWIGETIASGVLGAREAFRQAANAVSGLWEGVGQIWTSLSDLGKQIGTQVASGLGGAWDSFKNNVRNAISGMWTGVSEVWTSLWDLGKQAGSNLASGISGAWDSVKSNARNVIGAIGTGLSERWGEINTWGRQTMENVGYGLGGAWETIKSRAREIAGAIYNGFVYERWSDFWNWGKSVAENLANGIYGAYNAIKSAASWIANVFKSFLGWFSPPEEGPMSTGDKWMPNMIKTLSQGITSNLPAIQEAVTKVGETIGGLSDVQPVVGTRATARAEEYTTGVAAPALAPAGQQPGLSKQTIINLQPGVMIASKGEVRAFARMLQGVQEIEQQRVGRVEE